MFELRNSVNGTLSKYSNSSRGVTSMKNRDVRYGWAMIARGVVKGSQESTAGEGALVNQVIILSKPKSSRWTG